MATINKKFKTKSTAGEMKAYINMNILPNQAFKSMINTANWKGDKLFLTSKFGNGWVNLVDNEVEIYVDLNFFGSMAKRQIEAQLDKEFKQLEN
jgi:hypothetical protein